MSATADAIIPPQENEMANLSHAIVEWRRLSDEVGEYRQQIKERQKKMKALESVIVRVMKNHNIEALNLKNSGARVLYKKKKTQSGLGQKNLQKFLGQYMKSDEEAKKAMEYIQQQRDVVEKESIAYEVVEEKPAGATV